MKQYWIAISILVVMFWTAIVYWLHQEEFIFFIGTLIAFLLGLIVANKQIRIRWSKEKPVMMPDHLYKIEMLCDALMGSETESERYDIMQEIRKLCVQYLYAIETQQLADELDEATRPSDN